MSKEKSTHIRTQQIVIRKPHEAFRGAGVCTQIVRRIKNATSYLMQHHPEGKDQTLSHRDADKWLKKNNRELYAKLPPVKTQFRFSQNWNALVGDTVALEVRIVPKGNCFIIELIYDESKIVEAGRFCRLLDKSRKAGIDLGINNLIALATDQPGVRAVTNKRHRRMKDLLHRASSKVASYCLENNIGTLVIGYNVNWKQEINIGKVNNQKFVDIPHSILIAQIQYKCQNLGIATVIQEESYTSKASALDNDVLPVYGEKPKNVVPLFSGKRIRRGLYQSKHGIINADINGALNILRKATGDAFGLACKGCVFNPIMMELMPYKSVVIRRENATQPMAA
ncbi:IS200/IS605 family accessory protein TnpB-related protein [Marinobacter sp. LV10MA510-1]|uniref:IS200/IS605 family accessory protein TnpB-related protein n=1 Tax=Marinobacter sp. LV10MA510-1 TaxID=1415567 RepID=UPI000C01D174|nr:IS200/IS605 family accessory protein TnpB-related protein [Marinobacter sp. LV10MA510-1]PFG07875.1 IS605 OrfB family transposase [Marinobacter sp. LV10MA510-1]